MRHFTYYSLLAILTHHLLPHATALTLPLNLTAPNPPPSFSAKVHISNIPIDPVTAYVAATEAVFGWTIDATKFGGPAQWDAVLTNDLNFYWYKGARATVTLRPPPERPSGPPNPMKMAYVFLGIYKAMASIKEGQAFEVSVELYNSGRTLADLEIVNAP
ncbi:MAG: hypothetical protein Q9203_004462, partial [Teloschistes exilis]